MQLSLAFRFILPWAGKIGSARFQRAVVDWVPWKAVHDFRDIVDMMDYTTRQIFDAKKSALSSGEAKSDGGKDIMSILSTCTAVFLTDFLIFHPPTFYQCKKMPGPKMKTACPMQRS